MKTCVVGSRALVLDGDVAMHILSLLQSTPEGTILLREPLHEPIRPFEALVASLADVLGFTVEWCPPEPGGRGKVMLRNVEMVSKADEVIAFFPDGDEMTGGTAHVVEKAFDQEVPVRAFAVKGPELRLIGAEDWSTEA